MNIRSKLIINLFLLILIGLLYIDCTQRKLREEQQVKTELEIFSDKINNECPVAFNSIITLEGAKVIDGNILEYIFRVTNNLKWINDSANIAMMKEAYIYDIIYNKKISFIKQSDITISFLYTDVENNELLRISVQPEDYNNFNVPEIVNIYSEIEKTVKITEVNLPTEIGSGFYIVGAKAEKPATLEYHVQMTAVSKESFDSNRFIEINKHGNIQHIKNDGSSIKFRNHDVTFRYIYFDKNMKQLCKIEITPNDYK